MGTEKTTRYRDAKRRVEQRRALRIFLGHLTAYIIANSFFGVWNTLTYTITDNPTIWFPLPLLFWGIGVIIHFWVSVALFDRWWELDEEAIRSRLAKGTGEKPA